ncbi:hypothetical protein GCM10007884_48300 [Methylobacterium brachythecii]|nr:hypothetical protein GCM10007884_48300 [Methylobacterium brachythecii]
MPGPNDIANLGKTIEGAVKDPSSLLDPLKDSFGTAGAVVADPGAEIGKLNSDGDQVVMSGTLEGKLVVPIEGVPVGAKAQYGYNITVQQVGGAAPADPAQPGPNPAPAKPAQYDVTFDKNLLGGALVEGEVESKTLGGKTVGASAGVELNLRTVDSVTMRFDSKEDATRATQALERLAVSESVRDAASTATGGLSGGFPGSNPLAGDGSASGPSLPGGVGLPGIGVPGLNPLGPVMSKLGEVAADRLGPSAADTQFLRGHTTSFTQRLGGQARLKIGGKFDRLGLESRLDGNRDISRTIEMPRDGQPGKLTYTLSGDLQASTKEKLKAGAVDLGDDKSPVKLDYTPQNVMDHGAARGEVSLSWDVAPGAAFSTVSGRPVPETGLVDEGRLDRPDALSVKTELRYQTQGLADPSRTDQKRYTVEASVRNPRDNAGPAVGRLLDGDLEGAFRGMGDDFKVSTTTDTIKRDGVSQQHELGLAVGKKPEAIQAKVSVLGEVGRDDVIARSTREATGTQIADRLAGPGPAAPVPNDPPVTGSLPPEQLAVVPPDGVNVRTGPSTTAAEAGVLRHGTFVTATGQRRTDANGQEWVQVRGPDPAERPVEGWVDGAYLQAHPDGAMGPNGRIDPALEKQRYASRDLRPGDSLWDVAQREGVDFRDTVELNKDHLIEPGRVFAGDRVYLPGTGRPVEVAPAQPQQPPAAPPVAPAPQAPSVTSAPSGPTSQPSIPAGPGTTIVPGTPGAPAIPNAAPQPSRPDLGQVLRDYQVGDDAMTSWKPEFLGIGVPGIDAREVTKTEAAMLDHLSVPQLLDMKDIQEAAFSKADERFPPPTEHRAAFPAGAQGDQMFRQWAGNDGHNDAFRHAYWNARMTKQFGENFASAFTTAHEGAPGNPADREAMDLYNNGVGRRIAREHPDASDDELADLVQQAIGRGDMVVIDRSGNLAWSDQARYGEHGTADDAPAVGGHIPRPDPAAADSRPS